MRRILTLVLLAPVVAGCASKTPDAEKVPLGQLTNAVSATTAAVGETLSGTVVEQIPASQYLYLRLKTSKGDVWAAVTAAPVATGATVTVLSPMLMTKFESKTLNRTFDEVYFGTLASGGGASGAATTAASGTTAPTTGTPPSPKVDVGRVDKATGSDARTVAELWNQRTRLAGKSVTIRGVVVKANDGVMGKNWIHLQDGTGDTAQGNNDITVTSLDHAAKGETVTITGTVRTGKDFGAGYVYAVMVDDAKVSKK